MSRTTNRTLTLLGRSVALALALGWAVAGCGAVSSPSTNGGGASNSKGVSSSPTATARVTGSSTLNGCSSQQVPAARSAADVTVKQAGGESEKSIALRKGQTLEILLPATYHWRLATSNLGGALTEVGSGGWYDAATQSCAWRFTGANAGTVPLNFGATLVCDPGKMCPALAFEVGYRVSVT